MVSRPSSTLGEREKAPARAFGRWPYGYETAGLQGGTTRQLPNPTQRVPLLQCCLKLVRPTFQFSMTNYSPNPRPLWKYRRLNYEVVFPVESLILNLEIYLFVNATRVVVSMICTSSTSAEYKIGRSAIGTSL
jgi:hypothetical protein